MYSEQFLYIIFKQTADLVGRWRTGCAVQLFQETGLIIHLSPSLSFNSTNITLFGEQFQVCPLHTKGLHVLTGARFSFNHSVIIRKITPVNM